MFSCNQSLCDNFFYSPFSALQNDFLCFVYPKRNQGMSAYITFCCNFDTELNTRVCYLEALYEELFSLFQLWPLAVQNSRGDAFWFRFFGLAEVFSCWTRQSSPSLARHGHTISFFSRGQRACWIDNQSPSLHVTPVLNAITTEGSLGPIFLQ